LSELNTVSDFSKYLMKKERFVRSGKLISAAGEEDLVARHITTMDEDGEHGFGLPSDGMLGDAILLGPGLFAEVTSDPRYQAKRYADQSSYVWDQLVEQFTTNLLAGTSLFPEGQKYDLAGFGNALRYMALVPRYMRRVFGSAILDALEKGRGLVVLRAR
jgi:hypothetical protein